MNDHVLEDHFGGREFDGVGLFVDTTAGGAEALFEDLVLTELVPSSSRLAAAVPGVELGLIPLIWRPALFYPLPSDDDARGLPRA